MLYKAVNIIKLQKYIKNPKSTLKFSKYLLQNKN